MKRTYTFGGNRYNERCLVPGITTTCGNRRYGVSLLSCAAISWSRWVRIEPALSRMLPWEAALRRRAVEQPLEAARIRLIP